jgi:hypothetical protein
MLRSLLQAPARSSRIVPSKERVPDQHRCDQFDQEDCAQAETTDRNAWLTRGK